MGTRRRSVGVGDVIVAVLVVVVLGAVVVPAVPSWIGGLFGSTRVVTPWSDPMEALPPSQTATQLSSLHVRTIDESRRVPQYHRTSFGQAWADADHNGCDTRNDILARDVSRPVFKPGTGDCVVVSGTLAEPYTGAVIEFQRGRDTSSRVQIDHVVALGDAWHSGAWAWDAARRQEFANDQENLFAVDGQANEDKAASSADQWLPSNEAFRCRYASTQIAVKSKWGLSVTASERDALAAVLATCP